ncbi:hypothetical protein [Selenomonas ruminantium]|uniref:Uncharacterized protein n=1 Tax=Selenomonas ruminantium TaxID=971 RepID=A0A1I0VSA3_SELRU|nr:hypothetical protein [Selenomonas ruminantium]SFA78823.1 hypothetical protein SAMN05216587_101871 [Selenomonas ruminantium]
MKRLFVAWLMVAVMGLNFAVVEAAQTEIQPATMANFVQSFNRLVGNSMSQFSYQEKSNNTGGMEIYSCLLMDKKTLGKVYVSAVADAQGYLQVISLEILDGKNFGSRNASMVPLLAIQSCGNEVIDLQDALFLTSLIRDNWSNTGMPTPHRARWGGPSGKIYEVAFSKNVHLDGVAVGIMM